MTIDFPAIAAELLPESLALLQQWLPAGKLTGREYRIGSLKGEPGESLSINIDTGLWADFSTGQTGKDLTALYAAINGLTQAQAAKKLSNGHAAEDTYISGNQCATPPNHKYGKPTGIWEYKDYDGQTIGYVCRFQPLNKDKEFSPLTCWRKEDGKIVWKWKKWPQNSTPYNADKIIEKPSAKVLICYSDDTEILTNKGWKLFSLCNGGEKVAQYNKENEEIEFVNPSAWQVFRFNGEMVNFTADWCDLLVTPDHRMILKCQRGNPRIVEAKYAKANQQLPVSGFYKGNSKRPYSESQIRLIAAYQADGMKGKWNSVHFNLKKERKKRRLFQLLDECGFKYKKKSYKNTQEWEDIYLDEYGTKFLRKSLPEKKWNFSILDWHLEDRRILIDELQYWDGDHVGKVGIRFFTSDKINCDVISSLCAISGYGCIVRNDDRPERERSQRSYVLNITPRKWRIFSHKPSLKKYDGNVFCCTVPSGLIVVRRNGKTIISGNCEGERTAQAAEKLVTDDWIVISWCGGAGAVTKTDWSKLLTRYCWIWPDCDEPGIKAAKQLKKILPDLHIVQLPDGLPSKWDLADAVADFDILPFLMPQSKAVQQLTMEEVATSGRDKDQQGAIIFTHRDPANPLKLLATLQNMRDLLYHYNIVVRYNVISKRIFFSIPGEAFSVENGEDAAFACVFSYMKEWKLPVDGYQPYLMKIADENQYNPVMEWIGAKPWDGISRLQQLYNTIESPETEAKELLIRRWLITAVCMAKGEGVDSAGCLVLQGAQDMGKTWWAKKLVPEQLRNELVRTGANVNPSDKDSVSQIISYWIVELGEIGATFRKSDIDALKTFITNDHDTMRRPYGIGDKRYPRRTALIASVDQTIYLHDTAGNRRFWTIPCTSINSYHDIDMQQLWAEVLALVTNGESWRLEADEKAHIARINQDHVQIEPMHEMLRELYNPEMSELTQSWKTATQIARQLEIKNITQRETRTITSFLRKIGCKTRMSKGNMQFLL